MGLIIGCKCEWLPPEQQPCEFCEDEINYPDVPTAQVPQFEVLERTSDRGGTAPASDESMCGIV